MRKYKELRESFSDIPRDRQIALFQLMDAVEQSGAVFYYATIKTENSSDRMINGVKRKYLVLEFRNKAAGNHLMMAEIADNPFGGTTFDVNSKKKVGDDDNDGFGHEVITNMRKLSKEQGFDAVVRMLRADAEIPIDMLYAMMTGNELESLDRMSNHKILAFTKKAKDLGLV